ncbi:hypothetical protein [Haloarcula marina]|uniref:hypothetical protein n=1 Tax=Haloarcula marina TaxID=2961574 RepID=UPI0020B751EC|nr:hypothetical protein [Halomicroarcula marina]
MRSLDPSDPLFVGAFVAVLCLGIAGLITLAAPPGLPGFVEALVNVFVGFGIVFLVLGVIGAAIVWLFSD